MNKQAMREWIASLEEVLDNKLKKWLKHNKIENGEAVQLRWQWEQTHLHLDVFWEDNKEFVHMQYLSPRINHDYQWHGLDDLTFNRIMDRAGNLAQVTMYPPMDHFLG